MGSCQSEKKGSGEQCSLEMLFMAFGHDFKLVFFAWNATIVCIKNTENGTVFIAGPSFFLY